MNLHPERIRTAIDRDRLEKLTRAVLAVLSLVAVLTLASFLPGLDLLLPETEVTLAAVVGALVTVAVVGLLVYLSSALATLTRTVLDGPADVVENVASVVYWLVLLAAVLVAHAGLAAAVTPVFGEAVWLYDVVFLALALPALVVVAARLYVTLDPAAELLAESVADPEDGTGDGAHAPRHRRSDDGTADDAA